SPDTARTPISLVGASPMRIAQARLAVDTAPREIKEITDEIARWAEHQRISVGLLTLYIPHTSASLLIQENASPDVRRDLDAFLRRIVPENVALYRHNDEGPDDMPAHIKGDGVCGGWPPQQADRVRHRHQRDHCKSSSRPGHAKDEGGFTAGLGPDGRQ